MIINPTSSLVNSNISNAINISKQYSDDILLKESTNRINGDLESKQYIDILIEQESNSRIATDNAINKTIDSKDAENLMAANQYTDTAISSIIFPISDVDKQYVDEQDAAIKQLIDEEAAARVAEDNTTLTAANNYTNNKFAEFPHLSSTVDLFNSYIRWKCIYRGPLQNSQTAELEIALTDIPINELLIAVYRSDYGVNDGVTFHSVPAAGLTAVNGEQIGNTEITIDGLGNRGYYELVPQQFNRIYFPIRDGTANPYQAIIMFPTPKSIVIGGDSATLFALYWR